MKSRLRNMLLVLALAPGLMSCRFFRKTARPVPPPFNPPPQSEPASPQKAGMEIEWTPPPEIPPTEPAGPAAIPEGEAVRLPAPPEPRRTPPAVPAQQPPIEPPPAVAPAPQLRPMLTPAQTQELERTISVRFERAENLLRLLNQRRLSSEQLGVLNQIRTFLGQAEETRKTDLQRANNLAERAEVLAEDLEKQAR